MTGPAAEESPGPCRCHRSFAYISDMHPGHCCFWPEGQDCHQAEVAAWEAERDRRDRSVTADSMTDDLREIETGTDQYAWVVSATELTDQQAWLRSVPTAKPGLLRLPRQRGSSMSSHGELGRAP